MEKAIIPKETLGSVREIISQKSFDNPTYKGILYFIRDLAVFAFTIFLLWNVESWYILPFLWILVGLSISSLFIIGHDAAHGALFKSERLSYWIGQIAMLPSLHAYTQWAYGHNRIHHGHTIKLKGDVVWHPITPKQYRSFGLLRKGFHRIAWSVFGGGIYYLVEIWLKGMVIFTAPLKEALRDKIIMLTFAFGSAAAVFYFGGKTANGFDNSLGAWFLLKVWILPFLSWNYFIGITVYVHHIHAEIPWKGSKDWSPFYGQMMGTVNYHIPGFLNFFLHNIFIHSPHHVHMKIPFYRLGHALQEMKVHYSSFIQERKSIFKDYFRSTSRCKLMDEKTGCWMTYSEAFDDEDESEFKTAVNIS
ncbi:stearoyl-CoA 9-desaturase [Leptospira fainei serovar Hurstbridge str. BUT 6]|uniref:Stearoyl-CoA 9-desaturase n=1 Tax=Leptospira fainei serovar Hurstbridge str. BUT 6 TaxID=1193011 RepID=S3V447_9LEPT|nr:fatty acid desaturase [Leptospira fainei]EPG76203.1 stearoyl-CoA 9-desaturase [Leptospira fainei serovar Hurstbridge str. BUT 6]